MSSHSSHVQRLLAGLIAIISNRCCKHKAIRVVALLVLLLAERPVYEAAKKKGYLQVLLLRLRTRNRLL
jgi:hypothetical protein